MKFYVVKYFLLCTNDVTNVVVFTFANTNLIGFTNARIQDSSAKFN